MSSIVLAETAPVFSEGDFFAVVFFAVALRGLAVVFVGFALAIVILFCLHNIAFAAKIAGMAIY